MKSIVFCSSQRFKNELEDFIKTLKKRALERNMHLTVLDPDFGAEVEDVYRLSEKERLENSHYRATVAGKVYDHLFRKVKVADICFIFNKNGYLGTNTNGELFAASVLGKMIYALDERTLTGEYPHKLYEEPSSRKLIHEVVSSPEELLKRLM